MKKLLLSFSGISVILILNSCSPTYHRTTYPANRNQPSTMTGSSSTSASQIEREYQTLIKTYKSETAEVLTDLLMVPKTAKKTSITVENKPNVIWFKNLLEMTIF